mgnify:CR=1 FL=1
MQNPKNDEIGLSASYIFNKELQIWSRSDFSGISYSDGDEVETHIARVIKKARDLSIFSTELSEKCEDWTTTYHLSRERSNILRPFHNRMRGADVLEIGAGCGAITRYLGEIGAQTLALEGSIRRAAIARDRTRDLENVSVISDDFMAFESNKLFDFVTLIGVLEYANLFSNSADPTLDLLRKAHSLLKPKGQLIIAIENQLGLKYFAGSPEDHLGIPYYGIEGLYKRNQVQTFGRLMLQRKLSDAGFLGQELFFPLPDYKFPSSILNERALNDEQFDSTAFFWLNASRDRQNPKHPAFAQELVWQELVKNGLGQEFSNSFLLVGSPSSLPSDKDETLAWHFSVNRKLEFSKITSFHRRSPSSISVEVTRLSGATSDANVEHLTFKPEQTSRYAYGPTLDREFGLLAARPTLDLDSVVEFFRKYLSLLTRIESQENLPKNSPAPNDMGKFLISGQLFDAIPRNIVISKNGNSIFFDREWSVQNSLPLGYMVFRSIITLFDTVSLVGNPSTNEVKTLGDLLTYILNSLELPSDQIQIESFIEAESQICLIVFGDARKNVLKQRLNDPLPMRKRVDDLVHSNQQCITPTETAKSKIRKKESPAQKLLRRIKRRLSQFFS